MEKFTFEQAPKTPEKEVQPITPETGTLENSEEAPNTLNDQERLERMKSLKKLSYQLGFIETSAIEALREDIGAWMEASEGLLKEAAVNDKKNREVFIGYQIALTTRYYEQGDQDGYFDTLDGALDLALSNKYEDNDSIVTQLKELGAQ